MYFRTYFENRHEWGLDIGATGKTHNGIMHIKIEGLGNTALESDGAYIPHICKLPNQQYGRSSDPFSSVTAEGMNADEITRLFVGHHTNLDIAEKRFGTIIEGQRGTGKSMILKYLSFPVQIRTWQNKKEIFKHSFRRSVLPVSLQVAAGDLRQTRFRGNTRRNKARTRI